MKWSYSTSHTHTLPPSAPFSCLPTRCSGAAAVPHVPHGVQHRHGIKRSSIRRKSTLPRPQRVSNRAPPLPARTQAASAPIPALRPQTLHMHPRPRCSNSPYSRQPKSCTLSAPISPALRPPHRGSLCPIAPPAPLPSPIRRRPVRDAPRPTRPPHSPPTSGRPRSHTALISGLPSCARQAAGSLVTSLAAFSPASATPHMTAATISSRAHLHVVKINVGP